MSESSVVIFGFLRHLSLSCVVTKLRAQVKCNSFEHIFCNQSKLQVPALLLTYTVVLTKQQITAASQYLGTDQSSFQKLIFCFVKKEKLHFRLDGSRDKNHTRSSTKPSLLAADQCSWVLPNSIHKVWFIHMLIGFYWRQ